MSTVSQSAYPLSPIMVSLQAMIIPPGYVTAGSLSGGIATGTFGAGPMATQGSMTFQANYAPTVPPIPGGLAQYGTAESGIFWVSSSAAAMPNGGEILLLLLINWGQWYVQVFNNGSTYCAANIPPRGIAVLSGLTSPQFALCPNGGPAGSYEASLGKSMSGLMCPVEYLAG